MTEERREGPINGGNGGPVTPGAEPGPRGRHAAGGNGVSGPREVEPGGGVLTPEPDEPSVRIKGTRVSGLWVSLTLSAVVLLFLLIFILQNNVPTPIRFLGAQGTLPVGVALLLAAVLGVLLVAIPGYLRILQLRRAARRHGGH
jgi:uncharacterized integral membrane protein